MPNAWQRIATIGAMTAAMLLGRDATGQMLRLGSPRPPVLDEFTYSARIIGTLELEIAQRIAMERSATPVQQIVLRAGVTVRVIAIDLLTAGDAAARTPFDFSNPNAVVDRGSAAVLAGLCLADGRAEIDECLKRVVTLGERIEQSTGGIDEATAEQFREALASLKRFSADAESFAERLRDATPRTVNEIVPVALAPLVDVIDTFDTHDVTDHWISRTEVRLRPSMPASSETPIGRPVGSIQELRLRLARADVRADTRNELEEVLAFLERGEHFADLRARVVTYRRLISQVLDLVDAVARASWMGESTRDAYAERLHLGIVLFRNASTRDRGQRHLDRLEASRVMIDRITSLAEYPRPKVDLAPLEAAFLTADAMIENPAVAALGEEQMAKLVTVVDRMIAYRELEPVELKGEFRTLGARLESSYLDAEKSLLETIETLAANPRALSDPAFSSILANQKQYLEDLHRIRKLPEWIDTVRAIRPRATNGFYAQVRKMAEWLLDPARRMDAILAMDQFEQQMTLFLSVPFEDELRRATPDAVRTTGGQHQRLVNQLDEQRQRWADAWAVGDAGGEAANRMLLLFRLTQTIEDMAEVARLGEDASRLNAWAAWELDAATVAAAVSEVPNRLRLATQAAISGNDGELARQLDFVDNDAPLAKLIGRLASVLGPGMERLPRGAAGVVGQIAHAPGRDAWMAPRQRQIADICRFAIEQTYARTSDRPALAGECTLYVNDLADDLLAQLGDRRARLPTLLGFDGSDPLPPGEDGSRRP